MVPFAPGKRAAAPPPARLALALALVSLGTAAADAPVPPRSEIVFVRPAPRAAHSAAAPDVAAPHVLRRRSVDLDLTALRAGAKEPGGRIRFNLFDQVAPGGSIDRVERRGTRGLTMSGRLEEGGGFVLVVERAQVSGIVRMPGRQFTLGADADGRPLLEEIALEGLPECAGTALPPLESSRPPRRAPRDEVRAETPVPAVPDDGDLIDVLVAYTGAAETAAGGPAAVQALAQRAVDEANVAYANSGIATRLRLVWRGRTEYDESADDLLTHLVRLTTPGDGFMDEIHALRDATGADVVTLFENDLEAAGIGYLMQNENNFFASSAFSVMSAFAASNNLTLPHEIGHNQGCEHDRDHATYNPLAKDAYGKRFTGSDGRPYRTVMGYPPGQRIPNFSNPAVVYLGQPTGVANRENNTRVINLTADTVANFRLSRRHPGSVSDFDGNGADDLSTFDPDTGEWWIGLARPPVFDTLAWGSWPPSAAWPIHLRGDFDGDGFKDLAGFDVSTRQWWVSRSRGDRFDAQAWHQYPAGAGWLRHVAGDFDGNGRDDIASLETAGTLRVALSSGSAFISASWGTLANPPAWTLMLAGDYNGDGRNDLAHYREADGEWWVSLSGGGAFTTSRWGTNAPASGWGESASGDFNGDGRDDLAHFFTANGGMEWWVNLATNSSTFTTPARWR